MRRLPTARVMSLVWAVTALVRGAPTLAVTDMLRDTGVCTPPVGGPDHTCDGTMEGEWEQDPTCGLIAGGDNYNAGCNSHADPRPFSPIACGQTICGTWSTQVQGTTVLRDTDWYEIEFAEPTLMIVDITAEFDVSLGIITSCGTGDCDLRPAWPDFWAVGGYNSAACNDPAQSPGGYAADNHHHELCVGPGVWWVFVAGDWMQAPVICGDYVLTLQCQAPCHVPCCLDNDVCVEVSETDCVYLDDQCPGGLGGALAAAPDCVPGLCAWACEEAVELTCDSQTLVDNSVNSDLANPPMSCATGESIGVLWFSFVAEQDTVRISTCDSIEGDDSVLGLYEGDCEENLTELACSEDEDCGPGDWRAEIIYCDLLTVGETYYIQLASWGPSSQGVYQLEIDCGWICPDGACCLPSGSCTYASQNGCESEPLNGTFMGFGVSCDTPGLCDGGGLGACCLADGTCLPTEETLCESIGVEWIAGADCGPANPCTGACCTFAFGIYTCANSSEASCSGPSQTYYPDDECDDPLFDCLQAACLPQAARSCKLHGPAGDLCLDMGVRAGVEPRLGGITELEIDIADRVYDTNPVAVDCSLPWSGSVLASDPSVGPDNTVTVTFDPALPDEACCVIALACGAEVCVCGLEGDIDRSSLVTTGDASIIKPRFGDTPTDADAEFDFDVGGQITTADLSQVKPKFGHTIPGCQ